MTLRLDRASPKHAIWIALATLICGCGGGSDSGTASTPGSGSGSSSSAPVTGLALPNSVSVVTANNAG